MILSYFYLFLSSFFSAFASVLLKLSAQSHLSYQPFLLFINKSLAYKAVAVGLYGCGFIFYGLGLKKVELHTGYPTMVALTLLLVTIWDLYTGVKINRITVLALSTILFGVLLLLFNNDA